MKYSIIAAVSANRVIGKSGKIPWKIPEDMKRFKEITLYHPVIMGRKTYESIIESLGRPLPQRTNIVVSRNENFKPSGILTARSLDEAVEIASSINNEIYFIGGQRVYEQAIISATHLYLTEVKGNFDGDTYFPDFARDKWKEVNKIDRKGYSFVDLERL